MGRIRALARSIAALLCLFAFVSTTAAQTDVPRSYRFVNFGTSYEIQPDASMQVEETITYSFTGTYHRGFRSIPGDGTDGIEDILVIDGDTGEPLRRVGKQLDPLDPASWGAYTVYRDGNTTNIEWYFDATNTNRTWIIAYTARGVVTFGESIDELYWDIFSGLDAPIDRVEASVILPTPTVTHQAQWYRTGMATGTIERIDERTTSFIAEDFRTGEPATIAVGWDSGIVSREAYWRSIAPGIALGIVIPVVILLGALIWSWRYYRRAEGIANRVIIPQYAPPEGFVPAYAAHAVHGGIRPIDWAATVVDLAVRGAVRIERIPNRFEPSPEVRGILKFAGICAFLLSVSFLIAVVFGPGLVDLVYMPWEGIVAGLCFCAVVLFVTLKRHERYKIVRTDSPVPLEPFEQEFLDGLIPPGTTTWTAKEALKRGDEIQAALKSASEAVESAFAARFEGYDQPLESLTKWRGLFALIFFLLGIALLITDSFGVLEQVASVLFTSLYTPLILAGSGAALIVAYTRFVLVRLSPTGEDLRDHLLGFKLYLKTAERYRLQGLAPEQFERFLPYAMIFGVEKQWAKAFTGIAIAAPAWYIATGTPGTSSAAFSAPSFTSGFSASFASSFSSSAGGGASAGGGSAGGGGGGGGGGAS